MWDVQGLTVRCQSSSITVVMVLMLDAITPVQGTLPCSSNSADSCSSTKALCHHQIVESLNTFPSQMRSLIMRLFHSGFSLSTHKIWSRSVVSQTHPFFPNIQWHTVRQYTSVLHRTLTFVLSSRQLLYISAPTFSCILSAKKIVFPSPHHRGKSTCFQVSSYISPLVRRMAVSMRSLES